MRTALLLLLIVFSFLLKAQNSCLTPIYSYNYFIGFEQTKNSIWTTNNRGLVEWNKNNLEICAIYNYSNTPEDFEGPDNIYIDEMGEFWMAKSQKGVHKFDGQNWIFYDENIPIEYSGSETLHPIKQISSIVSDEEKVFFGNLRGVLTKEEFYWKLWELEEPIFQAPSGFNLGSNRFSNQVKKDVSGNIWALQRRNLCQTNPWTGFTTCDPFAFGISLFTENGFEKVFDIHNFTTGFTYGIYDFSVDSDDYMWISTSFNGLIKFDYENQLILETYPFPADGVIKQIEIDENGTMLVSTGEMIYDFFEGNYSPITNEPQNFGVFLKDENDQIFSRIGKLENGGIWNHWKKERLLNEITTKIEQDSSGRTWFFHLDGTSILDSTSWTNLPVLDTTFNISPATPTINWSIENGIVKQHLTDTIIEYPFPDSLFIYDDEFDITAESISENGTGWLVLSLIPEVDFKWIFKFSEGNWEEVKQVSAKQVNITTKGNQAWIVCTPFYYNWPKPTLIYFNENGTSFGSVLPHAIIQSWPYSYNGMGIYDTYLDANNNFWIHYTLTQYNDILGTNALSTGGSYIVQYNGVSIVCPEECTPGDPTNPCFRKTVYNIYQDNDKNLWFRGGSFGLATTKNMMPIVEVFKRDANCNDSKMVACVTNFGKPNFEYLWNDGSQNPIYLNPSPDNYEVIISGENDWETNEMVTIEGNEDLIFDTNLTVPVDGNDDGIIELFVEGGTPPYQFLWKNGSTEMPLQNLEKGLYEVTISDINGCEISSKIALTDSLSIDYQLDNVSCYDFENGKIALELSGGIPPFTYLLSNGDTSQILDSLSIGNYQMLVKDNGIFSEILNFEITQPDSISIEIIQQENPVQNQNDGIIELEISGGTSPFEINWNNGETGNYLENLEAGIYVATITDFNNCEKEIEIVLDEIVSTFEENYFTHLKISPNIFSDNFNIEFQLKESQNLRVSIKNILGQTVGTYFDGKVKGNERKYLRIEGSNWESGTYFLIIENETFQSVQRIVKI